MYQLHISRCGTNYLCPLKGERLPILLGLNLICDVGLATGGRETLRKLSLCYSTVYYYNGAQRYEQFLQVG